MYQRAQMPSIEERRRRGVRLLVKTRLVTAAAAAREINSTNVKQVIEARKVSDVVEGGREEGGEQPCSRQWTSTYFMPYFFCVYFSPFSFSSSFLQHALSISLFLSPPSSLSLPPSRSTSLPSHPMRAHAHTKNTNTCKNTHNR